MKLLKTLWAHMGKPHFLYAATALLLAEIAYSWYGISQRYDLSQVTSDSTYAIGAGAALTGVLLAALVGLVVGQLTLRYRGRPMAVDPDYPPTKLVYLQGEGEPERCACHDRVIEDGTEVWYWRQPAKLVCIRKGHSR